MQRGSDNIPQIKLSSPYRFFTITTPCVQQILSQAAKQAHFKPSIDLLIDGWFSDPFQRRSATAAQVWMP